MFTTKDITVIDGAIIYMEASRIPINLPRTWFALPFILFRYVSIFVALYNSLLNFIVIRIGTMILKNVLLISKCWN
jgi:hypothetical protein